MQNVDLISEINDLKRERKNLKDEITRKNIVAKMKYNQNQVDDVDEQVKYVYNIVLGAWTRIGRE